MESWDHVPASRKSLVLKCIYTSSSLLGDFLQWNMLGCWQSLDKLFGRLGLSARRIFVSLLLQLPNREVLVISEAVVTLVVLQ